MPAPFWLVPMGLILCRVGFALQLYRDWRRHGLSYVGWPTLALLALGSTLLSWWAVTLDPVTALACLAPALVDAWLGGLKARDWLRNRWGRAAPIGG